MVIIAMCLGLRVSEILALKWPDFDFEEGTLMITRGTVHGRIGRVKTEYSEDEMPLDPAFARIVQKWRMQCPASEGKWVFPNPNTGGVWHSSVLQGDILVPAGQEDRRTAAGLAYLPAQLPLAARCLRRSYRRAAETDEARSGKHDYEIWGCLYGRKTEGA